jgi:hypothetical protein
MHSYAGSWVHAQHLAGVTLPEGVARQDADLTNNERLQERRQ